MNKVKGTTEIKRQVSVIISLTTFPARIQDAEKTILSLLNQECKPDNILLWLAVEQFPNMEEDIPNNILELYPQVFQNLKDESIKDKIDIGNA